MPKKITISVLIILVLLILSGLGKQIINALEASTRLDQAADEVNRLQVENRQLKEELNQANQPEFIEQVAREKLNLSRPGETVVIIPEEVYKKAFATPQATAEAKLPNWQGWLKLFFP